MPSILSSLVTSLDVTQYSPTTAKVLMIGLPLVGGMASGLSMGDATRTWYKEIKRPWWNPPNWAFGPVWTSLYTSMGYAAYRVFYEHGTTTPRPLILYGTQLALNFLWTPIFFRYRQFGWALVDLVALLGTAGATAYEFYRVDPLAGQLLVPYLGWLSLAGSLTWYIWRHNPAGGYRRLEDERGGRKSTSSRRDY